MDENVCFGFKERMMNEPYPCGQLGSPNALAFHHDDTGVCARASSRGGRGQAHMVGVRHVSPCVRRSMEVLLIT